MLNATHLKKIATDNRIAEPTTVKEALGGPNKQLWVEAIAKEVKSIKDFGTYKTVRRQDIPDGALIMGLKEILKVKYAEDGTFDKCKFRITVQGYSQDLQKGDYKTSFAPAVSYASVKTIIALAAIEGSNLSTMDYSRQTTEDANIKHGHHDQRSRRRSRDHSVQCEISVVGVHTSMGPTHAPRDIIYGEPIATVC